MNQVSSIFTLFLTAAALILGAPADRDIEWLSLDVAAEEARGGKKPLLLYVHAPWCGPCLKMERDVFSEVEPLLKRFALAALDYDDNESSITAYGITRTPFGWATHYGAEATPTFILLTPTGSIITRASGYIDTRGFSLLLSYVATRAYNHTSFEDYAATVQL